MAILYIVRHGETEHNANHIIQGQIDSPLTNLGIKQAEETADKLKDINFTTCYHSPLGRTTTTAQTILKFHKIDVHTRDDLMEFNMGVLEGAVNDHNMHGEEFKNFAIFPHKYTIPVENGETYDTLTERVYNCCKEIADTHEADENILIVSHGGPIRSLLNPMIDKPRSEFWLSPDVTPASVSIVRWNRNSAPVLITLADTPEADISYDNTISQEMVRPN